MFLTKDAPTQYPCADSLELDGDKVRREEQQQVGARVPEVVAR